MLNSTKYLMFTMLSTILFLYDKFVPMLHKFPYTEYNVRRDVGHCIHVPNINLVTYLKCNRPTCWSFIYIYFVRIKDLIVTTGTFSCLIT